jgi:hypothetical protein
MVKAIAVFAIAALALVGTVVPASAIAIFSTDGGNDGTGVLTCLDGAVACGAPGNIFALNAPLPSPWVPNNPGGSNAVWVSFNANHSQDGQGPNVAQSDTDVTNGDPTVTFRYSFSLALPATLSFSVWADDTAGVLLDGLSLAAPNGVQDGACADGAIGCENGEEATFSNLALASGAHTIDFEVYQRVLNENGSGTPFGLLFAGDIAPVPEPATILLLGSALTAAGVASRRRWNRNKGAAS